MNKGMVDKDWDAVHAAVHKIIPSFSIVGINAEFEEMAKKVQEYASTLQQLDVMSDMVLQICKICNQACEELEIELIQIKNKN
jgi:NTP pyrophosphatase (non-canonical NTP hydrolase)